MVCVAAGWTAPAQAEVTFCNGGDRELFIATVLEDPNLRLFSSYPWTSRGFYRLKAEECAVVSAGRSDTMRVYFYVKYWLGDNFVSARYKPHGEVYESKERFCVNEQDGWGLAGADAVRCPPGYMLKPFPHKLVVPGNAFGYTLTLD